MKYALLIGLVLVLLIGGIILLKGMQGKKQSHLPVKTRTVLAKEVTVTLDSNGFSPKAVTIRTGTPVRWENKSGKQQTVNSDNYPSNQLHKELNFGIFNNDSSVMHTFTQPGIYGYHNQLHHEQEGTITVEK